MSENTYCVYMHTNITNRKKYIGITSKSPNIRWRKEGKGYKNSPFFWNAICKYGWDGFEHIILHNNLTAFEAKNIEMKLISQYQTNNNSFGYNITSGGDGGKGVKMTTEQKKYLMTFITKRIICFNKNDLRKQKIYESIISAANDCGVTSGSISNCCLKNKKSCAGYYWMYYHEYLTTGFDYDMIKSKNKSNSILNNMVIQYDNNQIYIKTWNNPKEASDNLDLCPYSIIQVCNGKRRTYASFIWTYLGEKPSSPYNKQRSKMIAQINPKTNSIIKVFDSIKDASIELKINSGHISNACSGKRKTCGSFKWAYA